MVAWIASVLRLVSYLRVEEGAVEEDSFYIILLLLYIKINKLHTLSKTIYAFIIMLLEKHFWTLLKEDYRMTPHHRLHKKLKIDRKANSSFCLCIYWKIRNGDHILLRISHKKHNDESYGNGKLCKFDSKGVIHQFFIISRRKEFQDRENRVIKTRVFGQQYNKLMRFWTRGRP